jgi:hypothetical protein
MTTYYLSSSQGKTGASAGNSSGITEGTSSPTADVIVSFPTATAVSRDAVIRILRGIVTYLLTDAANPAGTTIPFLR